VELRQVARDVYACLQFPQALGTSNSGLIARGGGLVVDTFWDLPHTRALIDTYARVRKSPARQVVNTHRNGDHCWGNQLFPDAEIIGHRLCAAEFRKESPQFMQALRDGAAAGDPALAAFGRQLARWDFSGIELTPPTTLVDDTLVLDVGGTEVHLLYVGPAHTSGDLLVHLPAERVLFTGDVLFRLCTPIGWEGTFERWTAALQRVIDLAPEVIVPGHGPISGVEGPREMKQYLEYVRAESRRFYDAGLSTLDAAKRIDLGPYADWTEPERLLFNVERAYREFRGEPYDAPIDVTTLFRGMHELASRRQEATPCASA
jgi:glyoxylase-like metal-dependent hydrolase (beta-lactamase superfamily II)